MPVVLVEKKTPQITVVTLNRPERRNALSIQLLTELIASIKLASDETRERILILRGAGAAFCTGLDLKEAQNQTKAHATADLVAHVLGALNEARPVTIAAVHGAAVAGGAGIMSACDYVVAAEGTKIGYPETRRGLVAGLVMTFLRRQLRERDMRELLLCGFRLQRPIWLPLLVEGGNAFTRFGRSTRLHMMLQCSLEIVFY